MSAVDLLTDERWELYLRLEEKTRLMRAAQREWHGGTARDILAAAHAAQVLEGEVDALLEEIGLLR